MVKVENQYLFISSEGETIAPNSDYPVENCQVLGIVSSENKMSALTRLVSENTWLESSGFEITQSRCIQILTENLRKDILFIADYFLEESRNSNNALGDKKIDSQIYNILKRLSKV